MDRIQSVLDGFVETGEYRIPLVGEYFVSNSSSAVMQNNQFNGRYSNRKILVRAGALTYQRDPYEPNDYVYEYDT